MIDNFKPSRGQLLFLGITLAALYLILPQIDMFRDGFKNLHNVNWVYLLIAFSFEIAANIFAGTTYYLLAKHRLRYIRTIIVQLAGNFVNRLLPAGIGGIGINFAYLKANRHTSAQAASVVAINNLLGGIGSITLLLFISITMSGVYNKLEIDKIRIDGKWKVIVALLIGLVLIIIFTKFHMRVKSGALSFFKQVIGYRKQPIKLVTALSTSTLLTVSKVFCLYFSALALGVHLSPPIMLVIFSAGVAFGTATPTPGGLGGIDAALVVGLTAFGVPLASSLAVTLLFRTLSCWIPVVAGIGFLYLAEHRAYFGKILKV